MPDPEIIRCMKCQHWLELQLIPSEVDGEEGRFIYICPAYPEGIPQDIVDEEDLHATVRKDQFGKFVFTRKR